MERETNPMQALCRSGCGFYGNPATDGLCSLCFKEALKKKQQPPVTPPSSSGQFSSVTSGAASLASLIDTATALPTVPSSLGAKEAVTAAAALDASDAADAAESQRSSSAASSDDGDEKDRDDKKKKNRCATCRKKVGLTGFQCRCGGLYCAVHRYSDKHECSFDYREMGAAEIRRNNPVVVGEKIQKI